MSALSLSPDLFSYDLGTPMPQASEKRDVHSSPKTSASAPNKCLSIGERTTAFCHREHPIGTASRVSVDTMKATRGRGIPVETLASMFKRGGDPSAGHLLILGRTYGWRFISAVFVEVDEVEAEQAARDLAAAEARCAALKTRGGR